MRFLSAKVLVFMHSKLQCVYFLSLHLFFKYNLKNTKILKIHLSVEFFMYNNKLKKFIKYIIQNILVEKKN